MSHRRPEDMPRPMPNWTKINEPTLAEMVKYLYELGKSREASEITTPARQAVIDWANSGGFAAVHATGGTVEIITDDLLAYLWRSGFKIAPLSDGEWF